MTVEELQDRFPARIGAGGPRVVKQYRGNGGIGVQKVELVTRGSSVAESIVRVQSARMRDETTEDVRLAEFLQRCEKYFTYAAGACVT